MRSAATLVLGAACLFGCDETQHAYYATAADAVAEGAIARGWLPEAFSADVIEIRESHDLDSNRGEADFRYTPELVPRLQRQCTAKSASVVHLVYQCGVFTVSLDPVRQGGHLSH